MTQFSGDEPGQNPLLDATGPGQDPVEALPLDFTTLVMAEHEKWLRYAYSRLLHRQDAEDAIQNAGFTLHQKWEQALGCSDRQAVEAFAWKIVKDAVTDIARGRGRHEARVRRLRESGAPEATGHEDVDLLVELDAVRWARDELAKAYPTQAEVVRLRQQGMSYPQIGQVLQIAAGTAKTYASQGWRHMQYLLDPRTEHGEGN
ncbi:RNA polymerase sigma factor [Kitasatospora sp. NPDC006697]|uniref:RNA polymerase sigma factor n=1 Tax=Kitasatospora sp. NPDC006697 TaxID=3364020 RepID=UPI00367F0E1C